MKRESSQHDMTSPSPIAKPNMIRESTCPIIEGGEATYFLSSPPQTKTLKRRCPPRDFATLTWRLYAWFSSAIRSAFAKPNFSPPWPSGAKQSATGETFLSFPRISDRFALVVVV